MRVELQSAYIIHRRAYRNTSWLLEVFTRDHGIVALVAKGARRTNHALRYLLEPFIGLQISFSGKGELMTLLAAESNNHRVLLSGNKLFAGMYLNELLQRLLHRNDPHQALYSAYDLVLHELNKSENLIEPALRRFELCLLREVGYGLLLDHDTETGEPIQPDSHYVYDIEKGPSLSVGLQPNCLCVSGRSLLALANEKFDDLLLLTEMKKILRVILNHYMGGKPLRSRELFTATRH